MTFDEWDRKTMADSRESPNAYARRAFNAGVRSVENMNAASKPIYQVFEPCDGTWTDCEKSTYDRTDGAFKRVVCLAKEPK